MSLDDNLLHDEEHKAAIEKAGQRISELVDKKRYREAVDYFEGLNNHAKKHIKKNPDYNWKLTVAIGSYKISKK